MFSLSCLGKSEQLGLSGRPTGEVGLLATSKLYMLDNKILAFIPQVTWIAFFICRFVVLMYN